MGLSYEDYLEAARLAEEREARMGADQAAEGADGRGSKNSAADADPSLPEGVEAGSPESLSLSPQWEGDERIDLCHAHICV